MNLRLSTLVVLVLVATPAASSGSATELASALASIDACRSTRDELANEGVDVDIALDCDGLDEALDALAIAPWVYPSLEDLDLSKLDALHDVLSGAAQPGGPPEGLRFDNLQAILDATLSDDRGDDGPSWWDRLRDWLAQLLERDDVANALDRFAPNETFRKVLLYLVILMVLVLVANELRRAGGWRLPRWRRSRPEGNAEVGIQQVEAPTLARLEGLSLRRLPVAVVNRCVEHLAATGVLPPAATLSYRDVLARLRNQAPSLVAPFLEPVAAAEASLYGLEPCTKDQAEACVALARTVLVGPLAEEGTGA